MEKLKGKKLLILGGIRHMLEVAERAKEFGNHIASSRNSCPNYW